MENILERVWHDLIARSTGPMKMRLIMQPTVASILAIRAGLRDFRRGHPPFLWAALTMRARRVDSLREAWADLGNVFIVAVVLDAIYQLYVQGRIYVVELLIVATGMALVPYVLIRGPVARITRRLVRRQA